LEHLAGCEDVLSVGCGPAIVESALSKHGFRITGLDVSREALDRAPNTVRTVAGSACDIPFQASSFDAVIFVASLQFIEDHEKAIEHTSRVLRSNGRLIVMLLNAESNFFKEKLCDPSSYVRKIRHTRLTEIESAIAKRFSVQTEYSLGIKEDTIFESRDGADAALYIVRGTRKEARCWRKGFPCQKKMKENSSETWHDYHSNRS
jgi:ubiquinone/menaquinone biosynthesis C-methylase UbiE